MKEDQAWYPVQESDVNINFSLYTGSRFVISRKYDFLFLYFNYFCGGWDIHWRYFNI
jgi:hypothetical protein